VLDSFAYPRRRVLAVCWNLELRSSMAVFVVVASTNSKLWSAMSRTKVLMPCLTPGVAKRYLKFCLCTVEVVTAFHHRVYASDRDLGACVSIESRDGR
jgi:hypothetical protein